jgi:hypothetical protein
MSQPSNDQALREQLVSLLDGGNAHVTFDDFVKDFPVEKCATRIEGLPYSAWQVLEHMRIAQWDILEFSRNANHVSPKWPKGYWPERTKPDRLICGTKPLRNFKRIWKPLQTSCAIRRQTCLRRFLTEPVRRSCGKRCCSRITIQIISVP